MFKDKETYRAYLDRQEISKLNIDAEDNYFQHSKNGEIIIKNKDYNISGIDIENYTNCIKWILLKDNRTMALLKRPFGDVYRNFDKEQYDVTLYNNILLPQIAKQLQNESAMYYIVQGNELSNNMRHLLTIDFKNENEELIHGEEILEQAGGDINELNIQNIMNYIEKYLSNLGIKNQDISTIKKEFIKQSFFNKFVKQADENNHNWGILINSTDNRARIAPIYDLDCCCDIGTLRKHFRTTQDGNKCSISSFIQDFGKYEWFSTYIQEVLEDFDINKAVKYAKNTTKIDIPENIQNYYKNYFGEKYYELKSAYQEYIKEQTNKQQKEEQNAER